MTDKFTNLNNTDHTTHDNIASINPKPPPFDDLYFETTNDFHTADYIVKKEGHLSKLWTTTDLYCVKSGYSGIYLAYDLHKRPHYMKSPSQFTMMEKKAKEDGINFHPIINDSWSEENNLYHYTNLSKTYQDGMGNFENEFYLSKVISMLLESNDPELRRVGSYSKAVGWTCQSQKQKKSDDVVRPLNSKITQVDGYYFRLLTKVFNEIFRHQIQSHPFKEHPLRCNEFAENLLFLADEELESTSHKKIGDEPENIFEALTYGLTILNESDATLTCHIDKFNDPHSGFNILMSVYFHHFYEPIGKTVRVAFLGYTRKCIFEYYRRQNKYNLLKGQLDQYLRCVGTRNEYSLQNAITLHQAKQTDFVYSIPFIDKCAFYSLFVYSIELFQDHFINNQRKVYLEDLIEIVTTIGWLTSPKLFYLTIKHWIDTNTLPSGNLCEEMINYIVETFGGLSCTDGPRMQTFCNENLRFIDILKAHKHIHHAINIANFTDPSELNHGLLLKELQQIHLVGPLSSQHILSVLSLSKIIKHTYYVTNALLCPMNRTKTMFWQHYGLNENTMNRYYKKIADEHFNGRTAMSENLGCEFIRDMYRNKTMPDVITTDLYNANLKKRCVNKVRFPDTFVGSQFIYKVESDGDFDKIFKYKWDTTNSQIIKEEYLIRQFWFDTERSWLKSQSYIDSEVIIVTNKKHQTNKKKRKPAKRKNPPKKIRLTRRKILDELKNLKKENFFRFDLPLPNFDMKSNAEIHIDSWSNVPSEEKNVIVDKLKLKGADSPTDSEIEILDDDDIEELNEVEEDDHFDAAESMKIEYDEGQHYLIKMLEDKDREINPFNQYFFVNEHSWYTDKVIDLQLNQFIQTELKLTSTLSKKNFVKYETYSKSHANTLFHAFINADSNKIFVSSYAWKQYEIGFDGYKPCEITKKKRLMVSQYRNKEDALKALLIYCLTEHNYNQWMKEVINDKWYEKYLPYENKESSIAIFNTNGQMKDFFGILYVSVHKEYKLFVPIDEKADIYLPWQIFYFEP